MWTIIYYKITIVCHQLIIILCYLKFFQYWEIVLIKISFPDIHILYDVNGNHIYNFNNADNLPNPGWFIDFE